MLWSLTVRRPTICSRIFERAGIQSIHPYAPPSASVSRSSSFTAATPRNMAAPTTYAFDPPAMPSVAIDGSSSERFPVHRIYCVGRNYSDHVREMGGDPKKSAPTFFTKPPDAVVASGSQIAYPMATSDLHYEVELVVCIGTGGVQIPVENALQHIFGYAVGLDLTRRDLQSMAKDKGLPWDSSKAFDQSAPIGSIRKVACDENASLHEDMARNKIQLRVNGVRKQDAALNQMIWSVPEIIQQLSKQFQLQPGDLIFTGTPAGVGPIVPGDKVLGTVEGLSEVTMELVYDRKMA